MALKRKFIEVEIPLLNETIEVLGTHETLNGKTIKLDMSRKLRGKGLEIVLKISNKEKELKAFPKTMQLMRFYIQRMMRKRSNYVEDSFDLQCSDVKARIKPFLITRKKVSRAVRNNLRKTAKEFLINYTKEKSYMELCNEILTGALQKEMLPKLKKVYPLSFCEIRVFETKDLDNANLSIALEKTSKNEINDIQQEVEESEEENTKEEIESDDAEQNKEEE